MTFPRVVSTAGVVLIATMIPAFTQGQSERRQDERKSKQRPAQQQEDQRVQRERQQVRDDRQHQRREETRDDRRYDRRQQAQRQRSREQAQAWQRQRGWLQGGGWQARGSWQESRARRWANEHRSWRQRGGYGGYYIPSNSFSLYFGRNNFFRIRSRPVMYQGYPRFERNGFSFLLVDPYPEHWAEDWYYTDDVYIDYDDYDDGYYLYNRRDPQFRLAISIVL